MAEALCFDRQSNNYGKPARTIALRIDKMRQSAGCYPTAQHHPPEEISFGNVPFLSISLDFRILNTDTIEHCASITASDVVTLTQCSDNVNQLYSILYKNDMPVYVIIYKKYVIVDPK